MVVYSLSCCGGRRNARIASVTHMQFACVPPAFEASWCVQSLCPQFGVGVASNAISTFLRMGLAGWSISGLQLRITFPYPMTEADPYDLIIYVTDDTITMTIDYHHRRLAYGDGL